MRKGVILGVLLALALAGGWMIMGRGAPQAADDARAGVRAEVTGVDREARTPVGAASRVEAPPAAAKPPAPGKRVASKQEREAMRRRILEAMQAREGAAGHEGGAKGEDGASRKPPEPEPAERELKKRPDDEAPTPGNLIDRTGNHGHMVKVMNEDLMPLVDECYALARETQPELTGLLVLNVEMIGDEDIGGVVESAVLGPENELVDPALVECVQESLLSVTLPPPPEGGKEELQLHMRLEPEE